MITGDQWDDALAREIDDYAWRAEQALRSGRPDAIDEAAHNYARAAQLEERAAEALNHLNQGPIGIGIPSALAVSSVALWYKAGRWADTERLAHRWLARAERLTPDAREQLRDLLQRAWVESQIDPELVAQTLPIELQLIGNDVGRGLAPARLVRHTQVWLANLLERIADWKRGLRYRERGSDRAAERVEILQAPTLAPGFGIRLYVRSTSDELSTEALLRTLFELLEAGAEEWEQLVLDPRHRRGILECVRELVPDGEHVTELVCTCPTWRIQLPEVRLDAEHRGPLDRMLGGDRMLVGDGGRREPGVRRPRWLLNDE